MTRADLYAKIDRAKRESEACWYASLRADIREHEARMQLAELDGDAREVGFYAGLVWRCRETAALAAERMRTP